MKRLFAFALATAIGYLAKAQLNLDSLQKKLSSEVVTTESLNSYLLTMKKIAGEEMAAKDMLCEWIMANCKAGANDSVKLAATLSLAESYFDKGDYPQATELCNKMLVTGNENAFYQLKCASLMLLSNIFYQNEAFDKKAEYVEKSRVLAEKNNYIKGVAIAKRAMAQVKIGSVPRLSKDSFYLYMNILKDCVKLWKELKDSANLLHTYAYIGQNYADYKQFDSAIYTMKTAESLAKDKEQDNISTFYYFIYGKIYFRKAKAENSKEDMLQAVSWFKYCIPLTQKLNQKKKESWCYDWLTGAYEYLGDYKESLNYSRKFADFYSEMVSEEGVQKLAGIQYKYETLKKNNEILSLSSSNKQKSTLNKIFAGGAVALFFIGFLGYRNLRYRQKQKIVQLQKEATEEKLKLTRLETEQFKNKFETEQVVNFFSNSLIDKSTVNGTMWDVAKNLIGTLGFEDCMMYLWNEDKTKMVQMAGYGTKGSIEEINKHIFDVMPGQGVVGHVMQTKQAILIPDTSLDARYRIDDMNRLSEITVPILYNNELIGIIDSENSAKNFFNERHLTILQTIAGMIAIKIKTIESETALQQTEIKLLQANEALQQKQLQAAEAMLKGQEEERGRLAKDLHDGLGGMLNGVKMSFNNMKENLVLTPDNASAFEQSVKQLDATITELRKVSHNLMPDVLMRFGLTDALTDYCKSLANNNTDIAFQQMGEPRELSNTLKLYVYRIIQELTNNALKHSKAKEIIAQLTFEPAKILITVDDNGMGFNTAELINSKGVGMQSIKQRVDYLGGILDIDSRPGKGTSVNIELNT
jgi:signal transduction histidine kinase/tetratricopeptide (TPR) repeat protein